MKGEVTGIYSLKELKEMSQGDLQRTIEQALYTDAYEEQRLSPTPFSSRHGAEYLESLLFSCPSCQAIGTLSSHKDRLRCSCGYEAIYTPYGTLKEASGSEKTLTEALKEEKERLSLLLAASSKEPLWSDQVTLSQIDANHQVLWKKEATLQAFGNGLRLDGTFLPSEQVTSISVVQRNRMSLHLRAQAETYELCGPPTFNALKYQLWERALGDQATLSFKETKEIED